jgi:hypothetical protein
MVTAGYQVSKIKAWPNNGNRVNETTINNKECTIEGCGKGKSIGEGDEG